MNRDIILVDAGTGNLRSVRKALENLGARVILTSDPERVRQGSQVVLPGVGAFRDFMHGLRANQLDAACIEIVQRGDLLLGICVGMQALFEWSEEMGYHRGLALLPGRVVHFPKFLELKIPHTGWNQLQLRIVSSLWNGLASGEYAYFNHSYLCVPADTNDVIGETDYGIQFACAVQRENLYGVQFHPEKSQRIGLQVLANFLTL